MNYSLYLHIPFCKHRCAYCDFNTYAGQEDMIPAYVDALRSEIQAAGESEAGRLGVHTIFFGGGTPSLLSPAQFDGILSAIFQNFDVAPDAEISIEANPGTTSLAYLRDLRKTGVNRISFGVQSADVGELRMLERIHDFFEVIDAVMWARKAGFDNLNLDLIYGLPEQSLATWQTTLRRILDLRPEHISAYGLTVEHGTPFGRWAARGLLPMPDPDLAAEMYEHTMDTLGAAGYAQYEISNWFKVEGSTFNVQPGKPCNHNLQYWRNLPYLGLGAGAHGYAGGYRYSNVLRIKTYIERARLKAEGSRLPFPLTFATVNQHKNTPHDDMNETMMTGLRLTIEGVSDSTFRERFGAGLMDVYGKEIKELVGWGLLEWAETLTPTPLPPGEGRRGEGRVLRLTRRGRMVGNQVFLRFVD